MNTIYEHKNEMTFIGYHIEMCSRFGAQAGMTNEEMKAYCEKSNFSIYFSIDISNFSIENRILKPNFSIYACSSSTVKLL